MKQKSIVIVDYGVGNIDSVRNAINALGYSRVTVSCNPQILHEADALILPGVGAYLECAEKLRERHLDVILSEIVFHENTPIMGICVGMQLMADYSEEGGIHAGLGWIPGAVRRFNLPRQFAIPHVGWNDIAPVPESDLFKSLPDHPNFYFDHSFHFDCDQSYVVASCDYGVKVTAAIRRGNIFGVQFHPEKSQNNGLRVFRNFFNCINR